MSFFRKSSPYEECVAVATSPANTIENWQKIMEVCDMISTQNQEDDAVKQMLKRLMDKNPNVQRQAIKLLNACCSNCGRNFKLALCSREFCGELKKLLAPRNATHPTVVKELKEMLTEWNTNFGGDGQLSLIGMTIQELKIQGVSFDVSSDTTSTVAVTEAKQKADQEEDELALAIAQSLSLAEVNNSASPGTASSRPKSHGNLSQARSARCLYDFEATEDNELSFKAGDVIVVTDHSDPNWWSGHDQHGSQGFFPTSFVSFDLNVEIEDLEVHEEEAPPPVVIDEQKLDECLDLLYDCMADLSEEKIAAIDKLQQECEAMAPLIDRQVGVFDQASEQLKDLHTRFETSQKLYEDMQTARPMPAMSQPPGSMGAYGNNMVSKQSMQYAQPPQHQQQHHQQQHHQSNQQYMGSPVMQGGMPQRGLPPSSQYNNSNNQQQQHQPPMMSQGYSGAQPMQQRPPLQGPSHGHAAPQNQIPTAGKPNFGVPMMGQPQQQQQQFTPPPQRQQQQPPPQQQQRQFMPQQPMSMPPTSSFTNQQQQHQQQQHQLPPPQQQQQFNSNVRF